jgi:predicted glycoside hydrolase/deacetylase ChbG (UPF0249 family)
LKHPPAYCVEFGNAPKLTEIRLYYTDMHVLKNIIATADDFGLNTTVNGAILKCYSMGYINSTSFLTNTPCFEESVELLKQNAIIKNVGVHINFADGKPVSNFKHYAYLNDDGTWNINKTNNKKLAVLNNELKASFFTEIDAQINRALASKIPVNHLDSHYHIHTVPIFYKLFLQAAKKHNLKLRLAQTYNEGNFIKFAYRKYVNQLYKANHINYSHRFETVRYFLNNEPGTVKNDVVELMLHPDIGPAGELIDHYDNATSDWITYLERIKKTL